MVDGSRTGLKSLFLVRRTAVLGSCCLKLDLSEGNTRPNNNTPELQQPEELEERAGTIQTSGRRELLDVTLSPNAQLTAARAPARQAAARTL